MYVDVENFTSLKISCISYRQHMYLIIEWIKFIIIVMKFKATLKYVVVFRMKKPREVDTQM